MAKKLKVVAVNIYGEVVPSVEQRPYYGEWVEQSCKRALIGAIKRAAKVAALYEGWVQVRQDGWVINEYDLDGKLI